MIWPSKWRGFHPQADMLGVRETLSQSCGCAAADLGQIALGMRLTFDDDGFCGDVVRASAEPTVRSARCSSPGRLSRVFSRYGSDG